MKKILMFTLLSILIPVSMTLTGCFGNKSYRVILKQVDNITFISDVSEAKEGEEVTLSYSNVAEGYEFSCFTVNGEEIEGNSFIMPKKKVEISAIVSKKQYSINYIIDASTFFVGENDVFNTYTIGTTKELPQVIKAGYNFVGWCKDSYLESPISEIAPTMCENLTLYPKFSLKTYTIDYHTNAETTNTNPITYNCEQSNIDLTQPVREGYIFLGWYYNSKFTGEPITEIDTSLCENLNIYPKFLTNKTDTAGYRLIETVTDFTILVNRYPEDNFKLCADLDFQGYDYVPVSVFSGKFDGANHKISNVTYKSTGLTNVGLFGTLLTAEVKDLSINFDFAPGLGVDGILNVGGLAGNAFNSGISNVRCEADSKIESKGYSNILMNIGGIVGFAENNTTITNCTAISPIINIEAALVVRVGAMCGFMRDNSVINGALVLIDSPITVKDTDKDSSVVTASVGGIVGEIKLSSSVKNSCVMQQQKTIKIIVSDDGSKVYVGGLIGLLENGSLLENSYANVDELIVEDKTSANTATSYAAGLVAYADGSEIKNCFLASKKLTLHNTEYFGFIVGGANNLQLTNCYARTATYIMFENTDRAVSAYDYSLIEFKSLVEIKEQIKQVWSADIWNIDLTQNTLPNFVK